MSFIGYILLKPTGNVALIYHNSEIIYKINLSKVEKTYYLDVENCKIKVEKGKISIIDSNCKNRICQSTNICLPNKVMIILKTEEYDTQAY
jgi:hypothetical protein